MQCVGLWIYYVTFFACVVIWNFFENIKYGAKCGIRLFILCGIHMTSFCNWELIFYFESTLTEERKFFL